MKTKKTFCQVVVTITFAVTLVFSIFIPATSTKGNSLVDALEPWQQAIIKINAARDRGVLTVDEAALYRLDALRDLFGLPVEFRPDTFGPDGPLPRSGLWALSQKLDALFADKAQWRATTLVTINIRRA